MNSSEAFLKISKSPKIQKRLAKFMAQQCVRSTSIEKIHAGTGPGSKAGDYSDVKVISPYGEIAWNNLSRISDDEMMALNIEVADKCYAFLATLFKMPENFAEFMGKTDPVPHWNEPTLPKRQS